MVSCVAYGFCVGISIPAYAAEYAAQDARGLIQLQAGQIATALQWFDQAIASDPDAISPRFHRGLAHAAQSNWEAAADDFTWVIERAPDLAEARLQLAAAQIQLNDCTAAMVSLQRLPEAEAGPRSLIYQGVCELRAGRYTRAREFLGTVATSDSELAKTAEQYLLISEQDERPDQEANPMVVQPWWVGASLGYAYDSNVTLGPDNRSLGIPSSGDSRAELDFAVGYSPMLERGLFLTVGYEFFQSLHFEQSELNLQNHSPSVTVGLQRGPWTLGLQGRYEYYFADDDALLGQFNAVPWLGFDAGRLGTTQLAYGYRDRSYKIEVLDDFLTGQNQEATVRHTIEIGDQGVFFAFGYRYDEERTVGTVSDAFAYRGQEVNGSIGRPLFCQTDAVLDYSYRQEDYDRDSVRDFEVRNDDEHRVVLTLRRPLSDRLWLRTGYDGTFNHSTQDIYTYTRHIGFAAIEGEL